MCGACSWGCWCREHRRRIPSHVRDIEALLEKLPGALGTCAKILQTLMTHQVWPLGVLVYWLWLL